ncbi:hypothetical protein R70006_06229 [Paraburkholderia domus]|uniref:hypothetical protein n=1 Tax=Paraburkholderia domus TaxID=2793075 RepID=UPI0019137052|nr:hypothetical protein [Paraburkholderia domus]MBK5052860.1 hypothetical protein [Burkholderia sp. R-70006]CAE6821641.1 hypothetical protein R70006_06229 [Paraburkholderia domus]
MSQQKPFDPLPLIALLKTIRPVYGACGSRDVDVTTQQQKIDGAIAMLEAMPALAPVPAPVTDAARDVLAERARHVPVEGGPPEHGEKHEDGELEAAAGYYALACAYPHERDIGRGRVPSYWPWDKSWWKPTTKRGNLVKAGGLILAAIERIDRTGGTDAA